MSHSCTREVQSMFGMWSSVFTHHQRAQAGLELIQLGRAAAQTAAAGSNGPRYGGELEAAGEGTRTSLSQMRVERNFVVTMET